MRMFWAGLFLVLHVTGCTRYSGNVGILDESHLTIYAAASLTDVMPELFAEFQQSYPEATVTFNFAGSSTLATQIQEGAAADIFLSANEDQMRHVKDAGLIVSEPQFFAANLLTVAVPADNPANIATLDDLTREGVRVVLPVRGVPARTYTEQMLITLENNGYDVAAFRDNVASEEANVRQVVGKVLLGEADAAIVYRSDVTPLIDDSVIALNIIPDAVNIMAQYPAGAIVGGNEAFATDFITYLRTDAAQAIFARWGFTPIDAE